MRQPIVSFREQLPLAVVVGLFAGLFSVAFYLVWQFIETLVWHGLESPWHRVWVSSLAGLVIGLLIVKLKDPGTMSDIVRHFHATGRLPLNDNKPIIPISLVGLTGGSSAGPEGVLTQVCGSAGSWLSEKLKKPHLTRVMTLAGMGAGFGAFLGAPVAGALLWLEMPHRKGLEYYEALVPAITASLVGHLVFTGLLGINLRPTWVIAPAAPEVAGSYLQLLAAVAVGLLVATIAIGYVAVFRSTGQIFAKLQTPIWVKTTLAGFLIGLIGAAVPLSYFYGRIQISTILVEDFAPLMLLIILLAKMVAAALTIRGHWQGGLIIPHIFMGAVAGKLLAMTVPGLNPTMAILCGMAAFNAAATQTPLASALVVTALSSFQAPIPVFLASFVAFFVGNRAELIGNKASRMPHESGLAEPQEMLHG